MIDRGRPGDASGAALDAGDPLSAGADELIDRTTAAPGPYRSPERAYAASACAGLAAGFGAVAIAALTVGGSASRVARANGIAAASLAVTALGLRLASPGTMPPGAHRPTPLADAAEGAALDYSIIIPVYNRPREIETLLGALAGIVADAALGRGEILVVDDGSSDDTAATVRRLAAAMPIATRVVTKPNGGVSSARNTGFAVGRGDIGIVIDSDCIPEADWLRSMLAAIRSDPSALVFARIRAGKRPVYPLENVPDRKGFVGASFGMMRCAYLALGGCYERYGASHDDRDLVLTALARGHAVAHAAHAWIAHPLRRETIRSMWRAGLNSRFGNLYAARHGEAAARGTRPTPYYFFGIGSHYGSSIAFVVAAANAALAVALYAADRERRPEVGRRAARVAAALAGTYVAGLSALAVATRARPRDVPAYVATLATFQLGTLVGRLRGTFEYGVFML